LIRRGLGVPKTSARPNVDVVRLASTHRGGDDSNADDSDQEAEDEEVQQQVNQDEQQAEENDPQVVQNAQQAG
jgi:hypothetical protein